MGVPAAIEGAAAATVGATMAPLHLGEIQDAVSALSNMKMSGDGPGGGGKFEQQLSRQLAKDGPKSIQKSLRSLEGRLAEHRGKLPGLRYKSSVEREIRTFESQIETIKRFMQENGL